jgi:hypothetical protein
VLTIQQRPIDSIISLIWSGSNDEKKNNYHTKKSKTKTRKKKENSFIHTSIYSKEKGWLVKSETILDHAENESSVRVNDHIHYVHQIYPIVNIFLSR